jgi:cardiolipin hydrolase
MASRPYVSTYFSPKLGAADQIVGFIDRCETTLDIAVYSITHDAIAEAILRAHQRGVEVRLLTDALQSAGKGSNYEALKLAGVAARVDTQRGSMHHKFCIGDGEAVITGSFNWSVNADQNNAENFVIVRLKYVIADFQAEYDRIWALNAA